MSTKVNLVLEAKSDFLYTFAYNDANGDNIIVTGFTANSSMKKHALSSNSIVLTTSLSNGSITVSLTRAQTANIEIGRYLYDVVVKDTNNTANRVYEGIITVSPGITGI